MRCYLIRDNHVTVLAAPPSSAPVDAIVIEAIKSMDARRFPTARLTAIWNALSGVTPVKRFTDRASGLKRLWAALEALPVSSSRASSKQAQMINLMQRPEGASIQDLMTATGWQQHSVRGLIAGTVRKKLGLAISSSKDGGTRIYRITA